MQVIIESRKHCQEKKALEIYGWCIMPSHVHMIIGSKKDKLEDIVRGMKKHTSITLKSIIKNNPLLGWYPSPAYLNYILSL